MDIEEMMGNSRDDDNANATRKHRREWDDSFPETEGTDEVTTQTGEVPESTGEADVELRTTQGVGISHI